MTSTNIKTELRNAQKSRMPGYIAVAGILYFVFIVLLLHFLSPELHPATRFISEYANSQYGYLLNSAFIALGLGSLLLAWTLARSGLVTLITDKIGIFLLVVWASAVMLDGIFPIDPGVEPVTLSGTVHLFAAMAAFIALMSASVLLSLGFRKKSETERLARPALLLVFLILLSFVASNFFIPLQGLTQRVFVLFCISWLLFVAIATTHTLRSPQAIA